MHLCSGAVFAVGFDKPRRFARFEEAVLRGREEAGLSPARFSGPVTGGKGFG